MKLKGHLSGKGNSGKKLLRIAIGKERPEGSWIEYKPGSVPTEVGDNHLSSSSVATRVKRST